MEDDEKLQAMCVYHTLMYGQWQTAGIKERIEMVKSLTVTYFEIRKGSYRVTAQWVRDAIDGLYAEFAGMIEERLPLTAKIEINEWMQTLSL